MGRNMVVVVVVVVVRCVHDAALWTQSLSIV